MEKIEVKEAINISGSIASITGISLLALEKSMPEFSVILIFSYLVASCFFIGGLGVIVNLSINAKKYLFERLKPLSAYSLVLLLAAFSITAVLFWAKVCHMLTKEFKYLVGWF